MLKFFIPAFFALALFACNPAETEPKVVLGREWNETAKVVADTASRFEANDVIVIQMDNGKPFPATDIELRVYQHESNRILFKRLYPVRRNESAHTLMGTKAKPLTAREILRTPTPGEYRIAFAIGDSIIAEKKLELFKGSKNEN